MKKKIIYWSPCLNHVGTVKATINSAKSLSNYDINHNYSIFLLNICGEWSNYENDLRKNNINFVNLTFKYFHLLPKKGKILSRISYLIIFIISFFPLILFLKREKPQYFIAHLVTSLPIFIFKLFNWKTKLILRISGYPKLNILRKIFWKISNNSIFKVTAPTNTTLKLLKESNIFSKNKMIYLPDPILNIKDIQKMKSDNSLINENLSISNSLVSIGRLTKQKNFSFLISAFGELQKKYKNINLFILGDGEQKQFLESEIQKLDLKDKVYLVGHQDNIFKYLKHAKIFVLTSLWEDPGFVLLEAAYMNKIVLSSDCPSGPKEILDNDNNGFLFKTNSYESFLKKFDDLINSDEDSIIFKKKCLKRKSKEFTFFNHFKILKLILN
ncbi:MAG: glycosyltransferase [Rickettsiales bacterium TMED254]|nr:MAG: glycosyltransferase [Rickettsiales bacterium TMED254]